ncbi:hypothetical protein TSAR_002892 [Trichomalopsis sarcophagae]|uniref:Uncharacterized protein n=1 Tax=Trichomalopsis sarcophagae TaxID=543379 RepID=A0A232EG69_9HYME|nr:hypothetical protein TSAR_002892 [Trichomalopsis sarcophagae]
MQKQKLDSILAHTGNNVMFSDNDSIVNNFNNCNPTDSINTSNIPMKIFEADLSMEIMANGLMSSVDYYMRLEKEQFTIGTYTGKNNHPIRDYRDLDEHGKAPEIFPSNYEITHIYPLKVEDRDIDMRSLLCYENFDKYLYSPLQQGCINLRLTFDLVKYRDQVAELLINESYSMQEIYLYCFDTKGTLTDNETVTCILCNRFAYKKCLKCKDTSKASVSLLYICNMCSNSACL